MSQVHPGSIPVILNETKFNRSGLGTKCHVSFRAVVHKVFHVEDPQMNTYQPADPQLKRYVSDAHVREDFYSSKSDFQHFHFRDPPFDMRYSLGTSV